MTTEAAQPTAGPGQPGPGASGGGAAQAALRVEDLSLAYVVRGIQRPVLLGVSFEIRPG